MNKKKNTHLDLDNKAALTASQIQKKTVNNKKRPKMLLDFSINDTVEKHTFTPNLQYYKPFKQFNYIYIVKFFATVREKNTTY